MNSLIKRIAINMLVFLIVLNQTGIVFGEESLSPWLLNDQSPMRDTKGDIAQHLEPGAIGNGFALIDLVSGNLPEKLELPRGRNSEYVVQPEALTDKIREATQVAIILTIKNKDRIPEEYRDRIEITLSNLIDLYNRQSKKLYPFRGVVNGAEDYLIGFNYEGMVGLDVELAEKLYEISTTRLAQYIFHECVPEHLSVSEELPQKGEVDRQDHKAVYEHIQKAVFGEDEVVSLQRNLRSHIEEKLNAKSEEGIVSDTPPFALTGITGFIGSNLARAAGQQNIAVTGLARADSRNRNRIPKRENITTSDMDLLDPDFRISSEIMQKNPVFYHLGGMSDHQKCKDDPERALASNVVSTAILSKMSAIHNTRFIFASTFYTYTLTNEDTYLPIKEEALERALEGDDKRFVELRSWLDKTEKAINKYADNYINKEGNLKESPLEFVKNKIKMPVLSKKDLAELGLADDYFYPLTKLLAERFVRAMNNGMIVRFSNIYGPGQDAHYKIPFYILGKDTSDGEHIDGAVDLKNGEPLVVRWGFRDYLYVGDCVKALLRAATIEINNDTKIINIASGTRTDNHSIGREITRMVVGEERIDSEGQDKEVYVCDNSRFKKYLHPEELTTLRDGIRSTIEYYAPDAVQGNRMPPGILQEKSRDKKKEDMKIDVSHEFPYQAEIFKNSLIKMLRQRPKEIFLLAVDTDISLNQRSLIMPLYKVIDQVKRMTDSEGNKLFPNLKVVRGSGSEEVLSRKIQECMEGNRSNTDNFENRNERIMIVTNKCNVENKNFSEYENDSWIVGIDDSRATLETYIPILEAITFAAMTVSGADIESLSIFYNQFSDYPVFTEDLEEMISNRVIYLLPRMTQIDTEKLRELYKIACDVYISA